MNPTSRKTRLFFGALLGAFMLWLFGDNHVLILHTCFVGIVAITFMFGVKDE